MRTVADGLRNRAGCRTIRRWVNIYDPADPVAGAGAIGDFWAEVED